MKSILFEPLDLAGLTLKNRVKMSAAALYRATPEGCALIPPGGSYRLRPDEASYS